MEWRLVVERGVRKWGKFEREDTCFIVVVIATITIKLGIPLAHLQSHVDLDASHLIT